MTQAADLVRSRRQGFAAPGGFHDKLIRFLAVALPGGVGVIVAVMILSPLSPRGEISFVLDRNKVETTNERIRVDAATYRGDDDKGRPFSVTADEAAQQSAKIPVVWMNDLTARLLLAEGPAQLTARDGSYDFSAQKIAITGAVDFTAADGYRMQTSGVSIDLRGRKVVGAGGVSGAIPAGTFSADRIVADLGERTIALDGNARLHMAPGKLRMP